MAKTNKVILIGNLGDAIKMHFFDDGNCVGRVSIATSESYKNKQGEKIISTEWHNLLFKNGIAKVMSEYTKKGSKIYIEGRLKYRTWTDDSGVEKKSTEIHVREMELLDSKNSNPEQQKTNTNNEPEIEDEHPDDLPF